MKSKSADFPRRNCQWLKFPVETDIQSAISKVEQLGAHPNLTEAQNHLQKALDLVSDFLESDLTP